VDKRILIIDDDRDLSDFLQQAFSAAGYEVDTVNRGASGLRKLLTENYHLALIDIDMPEISGLNVCRALRKHDHTRNLPVVMILSTSYNSDQIDVAKKNYGVNDFLLKPFTGSDLQRLLERVFVLEGSQEKAPAKEFHQLSDYTVPLQLQRLYREKATGLLSLHRSSTKKIIYIKDGCPIFARSNVLNECLGQMLVDQGIITQIDCDESVELCKESGRLQGAVLTEMGLLTPQELQASLIRQVTDKLLSTFTWNSGRWQFVPAKKFKNRVIQPTIKLTPAVLIMQGIERYWRPQQLKDFLYPFSEDYLFQASNPQYRFEDIELGKRGEAIFRGCWGKRTLTQILQQHPLARFEARKVIVALMISEMLECRATPFEGEVEEKFEEEEVMPIDSQLRQKILDDHKRIIDADYFEALGVARQCNPAEARKAYYRLAKEYHPDRFMGNELSSEMSHKVNEMFQYITQAYTILRDSGHCADYLKELEGGSQQPIDISQVIEAERSYQEGHALLKIRHFGAASKLLQRAVELSPEEPEYMTSFAWAHFKSAPQKSENQSRALEVLLASREINPRGDLTHYYLGHVYHSLNNVPQAEKSFEMAVQINPDCTEALRELRLINSRREQRPKPKGLFEKFMKKKQV